MTRVEAAEQHQSDAWRHALASSTWGWVAAFVRGIRTLEPQP